MPGLVRKLLLCAAVDGLYLHQVAPREDGRSIKVAYDTNTITTASASRDHVDSDKSIESHGVVGLLNLVSTSYLIAITEREQVASIRGKSIYAIRDVALIPLSSQSAAEHAISTVRRAQQHERDLIGEPNTSDVGEDVETSSIGDEPSEAAALEPPKGGVLSKSSSFVKDVVQEKGIYGRFAQSWFSKSGWNASGRRRQGMTSEENVAADEKLTLEQKKQEAEALPEDDPEGAMKSAKQEVVGEDEETASTKLKNQDRGHHRSSVIETLTPRIIRAARLYFASSGFYFSYDHDLSASLSTNAPPPSLPLWKRFDQTFFWNRHLLTPLIDAGQDAFLLPLLQGFVGERAFSIAPTARADPDVVYDAAPHQDDIVAEEEQHSAPPNTTEEQTSHEDFVITLVSRRSVKRAGLRYLRRGVDDRGNVANYVETEQILSRQSPDTSAKTFSLLQIRGSIPLFFSQSPYSFKPVPVLFGNEASNQAAFQSHFQKIVRQYGAVHAASLVNKHGTEAAIGEAYEHNAHILKERDNVDGMPVKFDWFDFHQICKGMRFDKVTEILAALENSLTSFGWTEKHDGHIARQQAGVIRTNCMDCLDRTNVLQSAIGGWALQNQLASLDLHIDLQADAETQWFNTLWADNGDAISKQYAGTAALKGDFTRTRHRHWTGALTDLGLTLNRYYNNIFGDYFLQLNIDFWLGNVGVQGFEEFEADMEGRDFAVDVGRVRREGVERCVEVVLGQDGDGDERVVEGWTLGCPSESGTLRSVPFEECVLLLTEAAIYFCRFDWETEKVGEVERVSLMDVTELWRGAYVTSTLGPTHTDEARNVGFVIRYRKAVVRTNTRALGNEEVVGDKEGDAESRFLAFKALPSDQSAGKETGEQESVRHICDEIQRVLVLAVRKEKGVDHLELEKLPVVQEKDVISREEARSSTGYLETLGYGLKKMVWS